MELGSAAEGERQGLSQGGRVLWDYWNALPKLGHVPFRSDFDPAAVVRLLPFISIVERRSADDWRIRLAGTDVGRQAGMETTGWNYLDLVDPTSRSTLATVLANIVSRPCAYRGIRVVRKRSGALIQVRSLVLPLRAANQEVRLLLALSEEVDRSAEPDGTAMSSLHIADWRFLDIGAGVPNP